MTQPRKILIIRLSALGDILHALPAFQSLRTTFPESRIGWLAERRSSFLLGSVPGIDRLHVLDTRALRITPFDGAAWRGLFSVLRAVRSECYDVSLDFQGLLKTAALGVLAGATDRVGFARDLVWEYPAHWFYHRRVAASAGARHVVDLNFLLAQAAGAKGTRPPAQLAASPQDERAIAELLRDERLDRFIVINPGGGWPTKRWPPRRYGGLARMIRRETGAEVVVTTGPGEEALYEEMARHCSEPAPRHLRVPFLQLIPLLRRTALLVGGDTGPFHLACALGVPVVGIFGPTSPARNGPWSPRDASVVRHLSCSFCHGRTCPTRNECMEISVEEVWAAVQRRLAAERTGRE